MKARGLMKRDIDYVIKDGQVVIVDEFTGRLMFGRRYSDGLHQAIEAKEGVKVEAATQTFATITLQNYFRMYHKLAGMTGTAETEAGEFWDIYKLDVVTIPTNRPVARIDMNDRVYKTKKEKYNDVIDEIQKMVEAGRPVLVGTTSVEISELLSRMLQLRRIPHNVLNAKLHQKEAESRGDNRNQYGGSWYGHQTDSRSKSRRRSGNHRYGTPRVTPRRPPAARTCRTSGRPGLFGVLCFARR